MSIAELGVYSGPVRTALDDNAEGVSTFEKFAGRPVTRRSDFLPDQTWRQLETCEWLFEAEAKSPVKRKLDLGVPMLPRQEAADGWTLSDVASGKTDSTWQRFADILALWNDKIDLYLRLGWEFNGSWYPWKANDYGAFCEAFRRVWTIIIQKAPLVKFIWNPSQGKYGLILPETCWPGDRYVDMVGLDFYDYHWLYQEKGTSKAIRDRVWKILAHDKYGLDWWAQFALDHRKPFVLPEWGPGIKYNGGGDNPDFVHRVLTHMEGLSAIEFGSYFNTGNNEVEHRLTLNTKLPLSAVAFQQRMSAWRTEG